MPVGQMGNYQEYLKRIAPPLREIESTPVRQHMFGNPFKIDKVNLDLTLVYLSNKVMFLITNLKRQRMMVDEADIDLVAGSSSQSSSRGVKRPAESPNPIPMRPSKRKAGPLPRDLCIKRPFSPFCPSSPTLAGPETLPTGDTSTKSHTLPPNNILPVFPTPSVSHTNSVLDSDDEFGPLVIANNEDTLPSDVVVSNGTFNSLSDEACQQLPEISTSLTTSFNSSTEVTIEPSISTSPSVNQFLNGDVKGKSTDLYKLRFVNLTVT